MHYTGKTFRLFLIGRSYDMEMLGICFFGAVDAFAQTGFAAAFRGTAVRPMHRAVFCGAGGVIVNLLPVSGNMKLFIFALFFYAWQRTFLKVSPGRAAGCTALSVTVMQACFGLVGALEGMAVIAALRLGILLKGGVIIALGNLLPVAVYCFLRRCFLPAAWSSDGDGKFPAGKLLSAAAIVILFNCSLITVADTEGKGLPCLAAASGALILWTAGCIKNFEQKKMCGMLCHIAEKRRTELSAFASLRHDMKNHLIVLERLISCGETERACRYISSLSGDTGLSGDICTGSAVLDALLCSKTSGLPAGVFDCHIRADIPAYISDRDICIIFGNMIDNAVNGCFVKGVPGEFYEGAFIDLRTVSQGEGVLIECRNYCVSEKFSEGTGIGNIRRAAARYGGTVTVCVRGNVFIVRVMLWECV